MAALGVDKVYRFVQFVSNKESRGWIDPVEFNIAAELAQIASYAKREAEFMQTKQIGNDMRHFIRKVPLATSASGTISGFDATVRHIISLRYSASNRPIQELTQAELAYALASTITAPSLDYPAWVWRYDTASSESVIQVYPTESTLLVDIEFLAYPTAPLWNYEISNSRPSYVETGGVIGDGDTVDFQFDEVLFLEIAMLILANCGVNLGMENVAQYGMAFNKQG